MTKQIHAYCFAFMLASPCLAQESTMKPHSALQYAENPPMEVITRMPPPLPKATEKFDIRPGYKLITTMNEFRDAIRQSNQKIRLKPGIYRAKTMDAPLDLPFREGIPGVGRNRKKGYQEHIFAVNGSNNFFDLRGVVFETPVSVVSKLTGKVHAADSWHINGARNTFIGGYFRNVIDMPYPTYNPTGNEFEVTGDHNRFFDCTFVIQGSIPYGYTDFYGKGAGSYGRLDKHCFMSIDHANDTQLIRCKVYQQSFGHCVHFHNVDGALIKDCFFTGAIRPTNDIFKEVKGRAVDNDFHMLYRKKQPIPRDRMIPLTEDGIRSYDNVRNIKVINTTVERMRGAIQLLCTGDVELENVTVLEPGDFSFDVSAVKGSKIVMKNCRSDVAYNPVFNLTRGEIPKKATYELTLLSPPEGSEPTDRTSLGIICGQQCTFILKEDLKRPLPEKVNYLICGGRQELTSSTIENRTKAKLILEKNVTNCKITSIGPVEDRGENNRVIQIRR
ncbi:hypothetical protein JIN77_04030 [Verrucomicrobiaceae bacterium R5-34]|uniref:Right-handed parallel beta-helix repeat-containing protein n=1 Tax=Oceaniferula flava TaxID=2800421 RepID=A0AAE2VD45_9BACT|nr:hypothetical protein [Oceaniferula flavus]MBK1829880.1 hypothetical protein [Verrucomicrobiaceae bacterium R5-34]MBK1856350.1 hypothetical protein [Oceaniferula flavus]MBM1137657.1 hypothetical protein [Oceaniferula flavus]